MKGSVYIWIQIADEISFIPYSVTQSLKRELRVAATLSFEVVTLMQCIGTERNGLFVFPPHPLLQTLSGAEAWILNGWVEYIQ